MGFTVILFVSSMKSKRSQKKESPPLFSSNPWSIPLLNFAGLPKGYIPSQAVVRAFHPVALENTKLYYNMNVVRFNFMHFQLLVPYVDGDHVKSEQILMIGNTYGIDPSYVKEPIPFRLEPESRLLDRIFMALRLWKAGKVARVPKPYYSSTPFSLSPEDFSYDNARPVSVPAVLHFG